MSRIGDDSLRIVNATHERCNGRPRYIQPANATFFERLGWRPTGGLVSYAGIAHQRKGTVGTVTDLVTPPSPVTLSAQPS